MCRSLFNHGKISLPRRQPFFSGRVDSVPGFEPKVSFDVVHGADWFHIDASKTHARPKVIAIAKDSNGIVSLEQSIQFGRRVAATLNLGYECKGTMAG